jgi:ubiquinone biosynthesis protein UbiJ
MVTSPPNTLIDSLLKSLQPPPWLVHEVQHRAVLFLNHVLMREEEARQRLARQKGRVIRLHWRAIEVNLLCTPAGLLNLAPALAVPDLSLGVSEPSPLELAQIALRGERPPVAIEGDVQLAAEVGWLVEHVRWDAEEDLSGLIGDVAAYRFMQGAQRLADALRRFIAASPMGGKPQA